MWLWQMQNLPMRKQWRWQQWLERLLRAGGCIWLHALEYRFTLDGDRYCFRSPLPEFVWGEAVPDGDSFCGKVVAAE